jgi:hypothetical protein
MAALKPTESAGRARVASAAESLQTALNALRREDAARTAARERVLAEVDRTTRESTLQVAARMANRRQVRIHLVTERLGGFLDLLAGNLAEERREASMRGARARVDAINREIDGLYAEFDAMVQGLCEDLK